MPEPVLVSVFADFLCPWCYVGSVRALRFKERHGDEVALEWKSYLLRPEPRETDVERFRAYARSWERPAALEPGLVFRCWEGDSAPPTHSLPAAVAGKVAEGYGEEASLAYRLALFAAYFGENRTISDPDVLADVAGSVGIDAAEFRRRLDDDRAVATDAVFDDFSDALELGVTSVPSVVLPGRLVLRGARDDHEYDEALARARAARVAD